MSVPTAATYVTVPFTASGSWTCPAGVSSVAVLLVGGGGAGFNGLTSTVSSVSGGGGGAGGVLYVGSLAVTAGTVYPVTVGAGGTQSSAAGNSVFNGQTAYAGDGIISPATNGSGYGGAWEIGSGGAGHVLPTAGTAGQGNTGGDCYTGGTTTTRSTTAGGGGGSGAVGGQPTGGNLGGAGGAGLSVTFPDGTGYAVGGGGGGGAGSTGGLGTAGAGGTGGGGAGGVQRTGQLAHTADIVLGQTTITLTSGTTGDMVAGDYIVGNGGLNGFDAGTRVVSILTGTSFTIDLPVTADTLGATFGTYIPPGNGAANTGGGGGGAGRTGVAAGYAVNGGNGGSGLVVIQYKI